MRTALAAAKAVLDKENATDSEIQTAIIQMTQAINAMEYGTNKVHLEAIIEVAERLWQIREIMQMFPHWKQQ